LTEPIYPAAITGIYGQFVAVSPFTGGGQIQPRDQADIQDAPGLRLTFAEAYLFESTNPPLGGAIVSGALTVSRTGADTSAALVVALSASPTGLLQFPASVTIPAGQESAIVTVEAIDNSAFDAAGFTNVILTASALGSGLGDGSTTVMILEDEASAPPSNSAPTDITLSPAIIAENSAVNTVVGTFSTTDVDTGDIFTYSLVAGDKDTDNASFNISGNSLRASARFDFETKSSYSVRVRTTDSANNTSEKAFTIRVEDLPEALTYSSWLGALTPSDAAFLDYVFGAVTPGTLDPSLRPTVAVTPKMSADLAAGPSGWVTTDVTVANVGAPREVNGVSVQQKTASVPVSGAKKFLRVEAVQQ
jgi:hypothetical protein